MKSYMDTFVEGWESHPKVASRLSLAVSAAKMLIFRVTRRSARWSPRIPRPSHFIAADSPYWRQPRGANPGTRSSAAKPHRNPGVGKISHTRSAPHHWEIDLQPTPPTVHRRSTGDWAVEIQQLLVERAERLSHVAQKFLGSAMSRGFPDQATEVGRLAFVVTHGRDLIGASMLATSACHATLPPGSSSPSMSGTMLWAEIPPCA